MQKSIFYYLAYWKRIPVVYQVITYKQLMFIRDTEIYSRLVFANYISTVSQLAGQHLYVQ